MKKLLLLLMLSFTMITYADTTNAKTLNVLETERLIDKYGGQAVESFNALVENTIPLAESGFKMVVKLQIAKGIGKLIPLLAFIILLINTIKHWDKLNELDDGGGVFLFWSVVGIIILGIMSCISTYKAILYLIVPEWFAIKEILNLI